MNITNAPSANIHLKLFLCTARLMAEKLEFYQYQYYEYEDEDDDVDEVYFSSSSSLHIGNRRWGDGGYIRSGRQQARPTNRSNLQDPGAAGSSCEPKKKEANSVHLRVDGQRGH
ncbi:hypothetical protein Dimus_021463 [Dionaea muscipula]